MNNNKNKKIIIIGAGIGGLATASMLSKSGCDVTIVEKNQMVGGRTRFFEKGGFLFDLGPSWYMMPDIFEHYFELMGEKVSDYLTLEKLSPSYRIFLENEEKNYDFFSDMDKNAEIFESIEKGAGEKLRKYIETTGYQYKIAKEEFMYKNYDTIFDFLNKRTMTEGRKLPLFAKVNNIVNKKFKSEILRKVLQYQTVLLGTAPSDTPGIYSMMNYVDFVDGIWYPQGGIYKLIEAMEKIALKNGVKILTNTSVEKIVVENNQVTGVLAGTEFISGDIVISNADMEHTDSKLLEQQYRMRTPQQWDKMIMAPSAFIMYIGMKDKVPNLVHHNLLFAKDWNKNFDQIFKRPERPNSPSLYICAPSKTDNNVAPPDKENLFVLVPVAAGLNFNEQELELYKKQIIQFIEKHMNIPDFANRIEVLETYTINDFLSDYNAFKGTALGPAHNLGQTAIFRPNNINKKVKNLFYVGAGTNPGIGMPICLISAELVYKRVMNITDHRALQKIEKIN
jgi:phytoene desaturase